MVSQLCVVGVALGCSPEDWVCKCGFVEKEGWRGGEYGRGRASGLRLLSPGDKMERRRC